MRFSSLQRLLFPVPLLALALAVPARAQVPPLGLPDLVAVRAYVAEYVPPPLQHGYKPVTGPIDFGRRVYLVCEVANDSRSPVRGRWQLGYYIDGKQVYSQNFGALPAGFRGSPAGWWIPSADGPHTYECRVDAAKAVRERSEMNNAARTSITVAPWSIDLAVGVHGQETGMWCWAASTQMAMQFLGTSVAQCDEANFRFNRTDCCSIQLCPSPVGSGPCVQGGWPNLDHWGFASQETAWGTALTFQQLSAEMSGNRPVLFAWGWVGGGGHLMLARGLSRVAGVEYVHMNDPWPPCQGGNRLVTYAEFVARAGDHVHWKDYYDVRKAAAAEVRFASAVLMDDGRGGALAAAELLGSADTAPVPARKAAGTPKGKSGGETPVHATAQAAATASLRALAATPTERVPGLGAADAAAAKVAEPISDYMVRLDELKTYAPGTDPNQLLHDTKSVVLPVSVGGQVKSAVTVAKVPGGYQTVAIGDEFLARALSQHAPEVPGAAAADRMIVRVPALRLVFAGRREGAQLVLVPLIDDPRLGLAAGKAVAAAAVFDKLAPIARETPGDQPG